MKEIEQLDLVIATSLLLFGMFFCTYIISGEFMALVFTGTFLFASTIALDKRTL